MGVLVMVARLPVLKLCSMVTGLSVSKAASVPDWEMTCFFTSSCISCPSISSRRRPLMDS